MHELRRYSLLTQTKAKHADQRDSLHLLCAPRGGTNASGFRSPWVFSTFANGTSLPQSPRRESHSQASFTKPTTSRVPTLSHPVALQTHTNNAEIPHGQGGRQTRLSLPERLETHENSKTNGLAYAAAKTSGSEPEPKPKSETPLTPPAAGVRLQHASTETDPKSVRACGRVRVDTVTAPETCTAGNEPSLPKRTNKKPRCHDHPSPCRTGVVKSSAKGFTMFIPMFSAEYLPISLTSGKPATASINKQTVSCTPAR